MMTAEYHYLHETVEDDGEYTWPAQGKPEPTLTALQQAYGYLQAARVLEHGNAEELALANTHAFVALADAATRIAECLEQQNTTAWGIRTKTATGPELVPVDVGSVGILYRPKAEG